MAKDTTNSLIIKYYPLEAYLLMKGKHRPTRSGFDARSIVAQSANLRSQRRDLGGERLD
jgi:hypothetical protein